MKKELHIKVLLQRESWGNFITTLLFVMAVFLGCLGFYAACVVCFILSVCESGYRKELDKEIEKQGEKK